MKIRTKLLVFAAPVMLAWALLMTTLARREVMAILIGQVSSRGKALASSISGLPELVAGIRAGNEGLLLERLQSPLEGGAIYAVAFSLQGRVLAHTNVAEKGKVYRDIPPLGALRAGAVVRQVAREGRPVMEVDHLVSEPSEPGEEGLVMGAPHAEAPVGIIRIGLPLSDARRTAAEISRQVLAIVFALSASAVSLALLFARSVLRPIRVLHMATERLGKGNLGETVPIVSKDELGDLARGFNLMSATLAMTTVSRDYLDSVLRNMLDGLIVTDAAGRIQTLNPTAAAMLGGKRAAWTGRKVEEVFSEESKGLDVEALLGSGGARTFEASLAGPRGTPVLCGVAALRRTGQPAGLVVTLKDITDRKKAELELARSNAELEQFAFIASHDLQEPLRKISGYCQLLERRYHGKLDHEADDYLRFAIDGAARMKGLINDLLSFARAGRQDRPFTLVDTRLALAKALENLEAAIKESGAVVAAETLPSLRADQTQLVQLFQNLVGNAIKFRGQGPPRVEVEAVRMGGDWRFSVSDRGIGIDPAFMERLFVLFQRYHARGEYPGTGIGLAICKKIVERHGGRIWAESNLGEGATFFFTLPASE